MKYLIGTVFLSSLLFSSQIDNKNLEAQIENASQNKYIKAYMEKDKTKDLNSFFNQMALTTGTLDKDGEIKNLVETQLKKTSTKEDNEKNLKTFKIFYFVSEDTSKDLIKNFSYDIQKLKEMDVSIEGLVLTNGLIGGSFDKMAEYVKGLQDYGVKKINVSFNPWAYEYFKLDKVPAYALSYCEEDYRFKTCNHRFLMRGETSLTYFFELVSDNKNEYKKYYQKLIEAK